MSPRGNAKPIQSTELRQRIVSLLATMLLNDLKRNPPVESDDELKKAA